MANINPHSAAAQEVADQTEFIMTAPIADVAKNFNVSVDEAVQMRVEAAQRTAALSEIAVNVRLLNNPQGKLIGLASVEYHGFHMDNFKVFNGENGLFLGEPTMRDGHSNNFVKTIRVTGEELRTALNQKALEGYNAAVEKLVARAAEARSMEVKPSMQKQFADGAKQAEAHNAALPQKGGGKAKSAELG
jgi:DNA-binding cell septation regulator SpoVG